MSPRKKSVKQRLSSDERRAALIEAALPVFAEVGLRGATTKLLAKRLGVSEALLYQHFPSKEALYTAVQEHCCARHPAGDFIFAGRAPSTETLVYLVYVFAQLLIDPPDTFELNQSMPRVMVQSVLDDGAFARNHLDRVFRPVIEMAAKSIAAARRAGDLDTEDSTPDDLRFIMGHHVIVMGHLGRLPSTPLFDYPSTDATIEHFVRFILRGIGVSDAAIARHFDPARLKEHLLGDLEHHARAAERS